MSHVPGSDGMLPPFSRFTASEIWPFCTKNTDQLLDKALHRMQHCI